MNRFRMCLLLLLVFAAACSLLPAADGEGELEAAPPTATAAETTTATTPIAATCQPTPPGNTPAGELSLFFPYEVRADGAVRLTGLPSGASNQNPAFSPDGTRLLFTCF